MVFLDQNLKFNNNIHKFKWELNAEAVNIKPGVTFDLNIFNGLLFSKFFNLTT